MSKVITALSHLDRSRQRKSSGDITPKAGPEASRPAAKSPVFRLDDRQTVYLMAALTLISLVAVVMSVQTLSQVRRTHDFIAGLSADIFDQDTRIASLERSFQAATRQQGENLETTRRDLGGLDEQVTRNSREINDTEIEMNLLRADLDEVKQMNQDLTERLIDMSEEVKIISKKHYLPLTGHPGG